VVQNHGSVLTPKHNFQPNRKRTQEAATERTTTLRDCTLTFFRIHMEVGGYGDSSVHGKHAACQNPIRMEVGGYGDSSLSQFFSLYLLAWSRELISKKKHNAEACCIHIQLEVDNGAQNLQPITKCTISTMLFDDAHSGSFDAGPGCLLHFGGSKPAIQVGPFPRVEMLHSVCVPFPAAGGQAVNCTRFRRP